LEAYEILTGARRKPSKPNNSDDNIELANLKKVAISEITNTLVKQNVS
jgi:hypothetical protein